MYRSRIPVVLLVVLSTAWLLATAALAQAPSQSVAPAVKAEPSAPDAVPAAKTGSPAPAAAPSPGVEKKPPAGKGSKKGEGWWYSADMRIMPEYYDFFKPDNTSENEYGFLGVRLRGSVGYKAAAWDARAELQNSLLTGIPQGSVAPSPAGLLGQGAVYQFFSKRKSIDTLGIRQLYFRLGKADKTSLQVGRFEYFDGLEAPSKDPVLAWVKNERVSRKTMATLNYNVWTRTFDGVRFDIDTEPVRVTGVVVRPTQVEPHFATDVRSVVVSNLAVTMKEKTLLPNSEAQVFWNHYDDSRPVPEVDNRPVRGTIASEGGNRVDTYGFHYVTRLGRDADAFVWYAQQTGKWGRETHHANAFQAEVGWQPPNVPWKPWLRVGYSGYSGDTRPGDTTHGTFMASVPDNRIVVPWWTTVNVHDVVGSVVLHPGPNTRARLDVHSLSLDSPNDFWYIGSGVAQQKGANGYVARPTAGSRDLGMSVALTLDQKLGKNDRMVLFFERYMGGKVVRSVFPKQSSGTILFLAYILSFP